MKTLKSVARIRTGYTFREKVEEVPKGGNACVIQIKDVRKIHEEGTSFNLRVEYLPQIKWTGKDSAFVSSECVLLPARGGYFKASHLASADSTSIPVVVSSQFLVLTPTKDILAEFLCWSLNQPSMQRLLIEYSQGTSIPMLKAETLKHLKLTVPSIEIQKQIVEINRLWEEERHITQALLKNRENMLQGMYEKLLKGNA